MSHAASAPKWLSAALAAHTPAPAPPAPSSPVAAGDIRRIEAMDATGPSPRLVLVRDVDPSDGTASVLLVSPETPMASADDILLPRSATGLPYDLITERDVQAPVWLVQLGPALARADLPDAGRPGNGTPLRDELDARWTWKEQELDELTALAADCIRQIAYGPPATIVDPLCLDPAAVARTALRHVALHVAEAARDRQPLLPAWLLLRPHDGAPSLSRWRSAVEPDVLEVLTRAALGGAAAYARRPEQPQQGWIDARTTNDEDPLVAVLADQMRRGSRCLRVLTSTALWRTGADGPSGPGAPLEVRIGGAKCQILWDAVDATAHEHG